MFRTTFPYSTQPLTDGNDATPMLRHQRRKGACWLLFIVWLFKFYGLFRLNATIHASAASKVSFQVNGLGGAKSVRAKEMNQSGIIPVGQGVYLSNAERSRMIHKFINQLVTDHA